MGSPCQTLALNIERQVKRGNTMAIVRPLESEVAWHLLVALLSVFNREMLKDVRTLVNLKLERIIKTHAAD